MDESQKFINELELPDTQIDVVPSVDAFSLHNTGSTLLFNMLLELSPHHKKNSPSKKSDE